MDSETNLPPGFKPADFDVKVSFKTILAAAETEFNELGLAPVIFQRENGLVLSLRQVDPTLKSFEAWKKELETLPISLLDEKYPSAFEAFVPFPK